jgi:oxygen-independent coproporphyrinogen-3 oxidase
MLVYIHIPFCDSKCHYCSFNSYVDKFDLKQEYMQSLKNQLIFELERFEVKKNQIESVFLGGGTPSTIKAKAYEEIFEILNPFLRKNVEITTEANPNSATKEWLNQMRSFGVNRVSFGVQSFDDKKLKLLNRAHSKNQAIKAVENAKEVGFENISIDLIYGVSCDSKELLKNDIKTASKLPINHLSAYALTIEENTHFEKTPQVATEELETTKWLFKTIKEELNFTQYEISNFGKYKSVHNLGYWEYKDYLGVGSGAVAKLRNKRFYPSANLEKYIKNPLFIQEEILTQEDIKFEKIFLGFRSEIGVEKEIFNQNELKNLKILEKEDKIYFLKNRFFNKDFLLADEISLFLSSN